MVSAMHVLGGVALGLGEIAHSSNRVRGRRHLIILTPRPWARQPPRGNARYHLEVGVGHLSPAGSARVEHLRLAAMPGVRRLSPMCRTLPVRASITHGMASPGS